MGAGLFNALKAMSSGCQGPVSSKPGFVKGWASSGMGTSSLSRQRHSLSRPRKLSIRPWTIWRNVHNCPVTGSSNVSSHFGQAYFLLTGAGDCRSARRAVRAAAISGLSSRVSVAIVCSTLTSRPFTFLVPNRSGNFWRMSSRIMVSGLLNSFVPARRTRSKNMISSDGGRRAAVGGAAPGAAHAPNRSWHIFYLSRDLQGWRRLLNHRQQGLPVRLEQLGNALLAYVGDDDLPNLSMHVREDRGDVVHRASIVAVDQE